MLPLEEAVLSTCLGSSSCRITQGHGWGGSAGPRAVCQVVVASSVTLFHVVNRTAISWRYCSAASR
jgi:hypothetical protein